MRARLHLATCARDADPVSACSQPAALRHAHLVLHRRTSLQNLPCRARLLKQVVLPARAWERRRHPETESTLTAPGALRRHRAGQPTWGRGQRESSTGREGPRGHPGRTRELGCRARPTGACRSGLSTPWESTVPGKARGSNTSRWERPPPPRGLGPQPTAPPRGSPLPPPAPRWEAERLRLGAGAPMPDAGIERRPQETRLSRSHLTTGVRTSQTPGGGDEGGRWGREGWTAENGPCAPQWHSLAPASHAGQDPSGPPLAGDPGALGPQAPACPAPAPAPAQAGAAPRGGGSTLAQGQEHGAFLLAPAVQGPPPRPHCSGQVCAARPRWLQPA